MIQKTIIIPLIFLLSTTILYAKSKEICHSVQLSSFVSNKSKVYDFTAQKYPKNCQLIKFTNTNAIRCGCFETRSEVTKELKSLQKFYPKAIQVTTYKYRFLRPQKKSILKVEVLAVPVKQVIKSKPTSKAVPVVVPVIQTHKKPTSVELEIVPEPNEESLSFLDDIAFQGNFDLIGQSYLKAPQGKNPFNITGLANLEVKYTKDDFMAKAKIRAQQDYHDFNIENDNQQTDRSFLRVDELYAQYDFEDDQILFGKNIRFWGALEVRNITDNFNSDELRADPFYKDKLGSWNASYSHFTDNGEFSVIVKLYEQSRDMSALPYVYYYFPATVKTPLGTTPLTYNNKLLTDDGDTRPSVYLKYSASTDSDYPIDYSIIFENGYDSQRYYTQTFNAVSNNLSIQENAYLVNKFLTYNTMVVNATLLKLEAVYADVINNAIISDYIHLGLGAEHTLTRVYNEADLGLILEYYSYTTLESDKRDDLELFELFQNDLFLGARYTLNDAQDTAIIGGAILDLDYDEQIYYIEYETRLADIIKVNFDYRYISPSKDSITAFNLMGVHERLSIKLGYYF